MGRKERLVKRSLAVLTATAIVSYVNNEHPVIIKSKNEQTFLTNSEPHKIQHESNQNTITDLPNLPNKKPNKSEKIIIIGDSITVRAEPFLRKKLKNSKDVIINARVSRPWKEGVQILNTMNTKNATIVFALGTNGPITQQDITNVITDAPHSKIVIPTVHMQRSWQDEVNFQILQAAKKYPQIHIADWNTTANNSHSLISSDGVHPTLNDGANKWAQLVKNEVNK